jgi:hypothetical protein
LKQVQECFSPLSLSLSSLCTYICKNVN